MKRERERERESAKERKERKRERTKEKELTKRIEKFLDLFGFWYFSNETIDKTDIYEEIEMDKTNICERASLQRCSVGVSNQEVKRTSHVPGPQKTRVWSPNDWFTPLEKHPLVRRFFATKIKIARCGSIDQTNGGCF